MKRKPELLAMFGHMNRMLSLLSKVGDDYVTVSWKTSVSCSFHGKQERHCRHGTLYTLPMDNVYDLNKVEY